MKSNFMLFVFWDLVSLTVQASDKPVPIFGFGRPSYMDSSAQIHIISPAEISSKREWIR